MNAPAVIEKSSEFPANADVEVVVAAPAPDADDDRKLSHDILALIEKDANFTDLMIEEGEPIMAKKPGGWEVSTIPPATRPDLFAFMRILEPNFEELILKGAVNRPIDLVRWRLRINAYLAYGGKKLMLSVRKIPKDPPTLAYTGLPAAVRLLLDCPRGLILVNGPTGSGKSTTLAAIIEEINMTRGGHIVTIEDPIEYLFTRKKAIFSQREILSDVSTFAQGVDDSLRQRPDIIVIGEIRDRATAETAFLASESGVLVLGTLHANDGIGAMQKMISFFPGEERASRLLSLSTNLVGVISQTLLPSQDKQNWVLAAELIINQKQQFAKAIADDRISSIFERLETGSQSITMEAALEALVKAKKVAITDAIRVLNPLDQKKLSEKFAR